VRIAAKSQTPKNTHKRKSVETYAIQKLNTLSVAISVYFYAKSDEKNGKFPGYDDKILKTFSVTCSGGKGTRQSVSTVAFTHGNATSI
jgi:hypothetical protein